MKRPGVTGSPPRRAVLMRRAGPRPSAASSSSAAAFQNSSGISLEALGSAIQGLHGSPLRLRESLLRLRVSVGERQAGSLGLPLDPIDPPRARLLPFGPVEAGSVEAVGHPV